MAQAGYTPISLYYSTTSTQEPTAGNLVSGELAINIADGKLFYKNSAGNVRLLSIGYGSSSVTPTNGGVQYGTGTALALTAAGSSGQILRSNGAAAPTWADLSTLGVNTISFGTTGLTPNSATAGAVTVAGTLVTANGGTGLGGATPFTANGVLYASSASALTSGSALTFDGSTQALAASGYGVYRVSGGSAGGGYFETHNNSGTRIGSFGSENGGDMYLGTRVNNPIIFLQNNSEAMRLTSTGLGIGTSSISSKLVVKVQTNANAEFRTTDAIFGTVVGGVGIDALNDARSSVVPFGIRGSTLSFGTSAGLSATLDSSGNLGLGVTPSGWSNRKAFEGLYGGALSFDGVFLQTAVSSNCYYNGTNWIYKLTNWGATRYETGDISNGAPFHKWYVAPSGTAGNAITFTQAMALDASGNLLLGNTSAIYNNTNRTALNVNGTSEALISLSRGNSTSTAGYLFHQSGEFRIFQVENSPMIFGTNNTERARITSGGEFLVGQTATGLQNSTSFAAGPSAAGFVANHANGVGSGTTYGNFGYNGAAIGSITQNGTTGVLYNITSDYRLKNVIGSVTGSGERIDALEPVDYTWKADGSTARGFLAHKFQEVYPNSVTGSKDEIDTEGNPVYQAMQASSSEVIADLVAEIQSLRQRVALLEGN